MNLQFIIVSQITLRGGNRNRFLGQLFQTEQIVPHPDFNLNYDFDVAVIKTVEMLIEKNNFIKPIALGLQGTISEPGSSGNITGWGITEAKRSFFLKLFHRNLLQRIILHQISDTSLSENLKIATVRFLSHAECNTSLITFGGTTVK